MKKSIQSYYQSVLKRRIDRLRKTHQKEIDRVLKIMNIDYQRISDLRVSDLIRLEELIRHHV